MGIVNGMEIDDLDGGVAVTVAIIPRSRDRTQLFSIVITQKKKPKRLWPGPKP